MERPTEGFDRRLREWSQTEPTIDELTLKRNLLQQLTPRRTRTKTRLVFATAFAGSVLALVIGLNTMRVTVPPAAQTETSVVHEVGENVILVLREGGEPIYLATEPIADSEGD